MEADPIETQYWCHICSRSVNPLINEDDGDIITCNLCESGFVEQVIPSPPSPPITTDHHHHHRQASDSLWAPILVGILNDHDTVSQTPPESSNIGNTEEDNNNHEDDDSDDEDDSDSDDEDDYVNVEIDLDQRVEDFIRRRSGRGGNATGMLDLLLDIDNQESVLINSFNQRIQIQDSLGHRHRRRISRRSIGDYFIGPGFESLLERLSENDPNNNRYGTPPATKEAIESLSNVRVAGGGEESLCLLQCTVCLDEFEIGVVAKEMPCKHVFHGECLLPWLELHSSCPVCRYLLPRGEEDDDGESKNDAETSRNDDDNSVASMEGNDGSSLESRSVNRGEF